MDWQIAILLLQDGLTNGAVYALLGIAIVLVFAVTRVIFVPKVTNSPCGTKMMRVTANTSTIAMPSNA